MELGGSARDRRGYGTKSGIDPEETVLVIAEGEEGFHGAQYELWGQQISLATIDAITRRYLTRRNSSSLVNMSERATIRVT